MITLSSVPFRVERAERTKDDNARDEDETLLKAQFGN
jgi:hypothetical protein